jgi:hypothetical protein
MRSPAQQSLLRRTLATLAALAAFFVASPSQALTISLSGSSGSSCSYDGALHVDPSGNISVTCQGGSTSAPGAFILSGPSTLSVGGSGTITITRSGGNAGSATVAYAIGGTCTAASGTLTYPDAGGTVQTVPAGAAAAGTCTVTLSNPTTATLGFPASLSITVSAGSTPPPSSGCPSGFTTPTDLVVQSFAGIGRPINQYLKSGQIMTVPLLPSIVSLGNYGGQVAFSYAGGMINPNSAVIEMTLSTCSGYVETDGTTSAHPHGNWCALRQANGQNGGSVTWFARAYPLYGISSQATASSFTACWAPESSGPYYLNFRWTGTCSSQTCGYPVQMNIGY